MKGRKNPLDGTRVIGFVYINWKSEKIACDLYEGNQIVRPDGRVAKISDENYQKMYDLYLLEVKAGNRIHTAAEANERMQVLDVPAYTADPQASEKEYAMRDAAETEEAEIKSEESEAIVAPEMGDTERKLPEGSISRPLADVEKVAVEETSKEGPAEIERLPAKVEKPGRSGSRLLSILLIVWLICISGALVWLFYLGYAGDGLPVAEENRGEASVGVSSDQSEYVVIALAEDVELADEISEEDIKGVIVSKEQYDSYQSATYVDADGEVQDTSLILWDQRSEVIGKYAAADLKAGSLLYDTDLSSLHVVADKTYVEATINGEDGSYEVDAGSLSGNTKIQIVAVVTTDGEEPVQVLLTQMTLQDRSLESIFDAAGQDILEQLSGAAEEETDGTEEEE